MPEIQERISRGSPYAWSQDPAVKYPDAWVVSATGMVIHLTGIRASSLTQAFRGHERATPQNNWCVGESRLQKIEDFSPPHGARILWKGLGVFPESPGNFEWENYLNTPGEECPLVLVFANRSWRVGRLLSYNVAQKTCWVSVQGFMVSLLFKAKGVFPLLLPEGMGVSVEQVSGKTESLYDFVVGRKAQVTLAKSSYYGQVAEIGEVVRIDGLPRHVALRGLKGEPKGALAWFAVENLQLLPEEPKLAPAPPAEAPAPLEDTVDFPAAPEPAPKPVPTPLSVGDRVQTNGNVPPRWSWKAGKVSRISPMPEGSTYRELYYVDLEGDSSEYSGPFSRDQLTLLMPESMVEAPEQPSSNPGELPPEKPRYRAPAPGEDLTGKSIRMTTSQTKGEVVGRWESPIKENVWKVRSQGETRPIHQKFLEVEDVEPTSEIAKVLSAAAGELRVEEVENPPKINDLQAGVLIGVGDWLSAMPGRSVKITWDAEAQRFIFGIRDVDGTGMDTDYGRVCREAVPVLINAMMDVSRLNQASGLEPIPDGTWHSIGGPTP